MVEHTVNGVCPHIAAICCYSTCHCEILLNTVYVEKELGVAEGLQK